MREMASRSPAGVLRTAAVTGGVGALRNAWRDKREAAARRAPPQLLGKILYIEGVTVSFDGFKALDG